MYIVKAASLYTLHRSSSKLIILMISVMPTINVLISFSKLTHNKIMIDNNKLYIRKLE